MGFNIKGERGLERMQREQQKARREGTWQLNSFERG